MSFVQYVDYSDERGSSITPRKQPSTLLGKLLRWAADKTLNSLLESFLQIFLAGAWYVRLAGAVVTGVAAGTTVWLVAETVLPSLLGGSATPAAVALASVAGFALGYGGGLLAGAGAGWLLSVIAESISTELSKDPLSAHFESWALWCLSTLVGGIAGWAFGRMADAVRRRSAAAGLAIRMLSYVLLFAAVALVLVRTGASTALWSSAGRVVTTGPRSDALAVGIGLGFVSAFVAAFYCSWCYAEWSFVTEVMPPSGSFSRVYLPVWQALATAMLWILAIVDSTAGSTMSVTVLLSVAVWIVPWALVAAVAWVVNVWRYR